MWSSPPAGEDGRGGGPGRPGGRGGAPPPAEGRKAEEGETGGGGLELPEGGGGGGTSRGIDGRWPPRGGGGGRSSGSGGLPPGGVGGREGLLLFGGGGRGAENPGLGPAGEPPGGGSPCLPGGRPGGGGPEDGGGLGPPGRAGGGSPPRGWKPWLGRGVLGTGGGPPGVSCLDEKLGRPLGRSGTLPRPPAGAPGSLGGPVEPPPPPKGVGPPERPPGGNTGPRLGAESDGEKRPKHKHQLCFWVGFYFHQEFMTFYLTPSFFFTIFNSASCRPQFWNPSCKQAS